MTEPADDKAVETQEIDTVAARGQQARLHAMRLARRAALALPLLLAGCGGGEPPAAAPGPWVRIDLWREPPRVELPAGPGAPYAAELGRLGRHGMAGGAAAGRVRVVTQRAGSRLAWTVDLPPVAPYLSLTPLGSPRGDCPCLHRAGVRDADGEIHELYRARAAPAPRLAPAAAELDLGPFAGTRVEVLLQVDLAPGVEPSLLAAAGGAPRVAWASPAVYGRLAPGADGAPRDGRTAPEAAAAGAGRPGVRGPLNVLLLGLGSTRFDAVGPRRYGPSLTPTLDALAAEGDAWDSAFAPSHATGPSVASLLTGFHPARRAAGDPATPLPAGRATLAERFADAGYATYAALGSGALAGAGLGRGFAEVEASDDADAGELVADRAIEWLAGRGEPWFVWLHFDDPRPPHTPPQPYALGFRPAAAAGLGPVGGWLPFRPPGPPDGPTPGAREDLYAGEVAYLDRQLGRVLGLLAARGALDRTVVAAVADHGEALGGPARPAALGDPITHVPLIIRWPESLLEGPSWLPRRGRRFSGLVQTFDLFPTLLAAAGLEVPPTDALDLRLLTPEPDGPDPAANPPGRRHLLAAQPPPTPPPPAAPAPARTAGEGRGGSPPPGGRGAPGVCEWR